VLTPWKGRIKPLTADDLHIGDLVYLLSGGNLMVVADDSHPIKPDRVRLVWHDDLGEPQSVWYPVAILRRPTADELKGEANEPDAH